MKYNLSKKFKDDLPEKDNARNNLKYCSSAKLKPHETTKTL